MIIPMFLFLKLFFSFSNAAKATALEGSTTIFIRSHINFIALIISSSLTRIIVLTCANMIGKFRSPKNVLKPSAMVLELSLNTIFPLFKDR